MYRVVNSTLAAESQNLSKGLSELAWSVTVYKDLITEGFDLKEWQRALKDQRVMTLAKDDMDETLKQSPCVVDAKSLWSFGGSRSSKSSERAAGAAEAGSSGVVGYYWWYQVRKSKKVKDRITPQVNFFPIIRKSG